MTTAPRRAAVVITAVLGCRDAGDPGIVVVTDSSEATGSPGSSNAFDGGSEVDDGYEVDDGAEGCAYACPDPPSPEDDGGSGVSFECDLWAQGCPTGEKCMPWANDGGQVWNASRCAPLDPNPATTGGECSVEGSGVSGIDDCGVAAMCWGVDPQTNRGTCVDLCVGAATRPLCEDPTRTCLATDGGVLFVCLPQCDPLVEECAVGHACRPTDGGFACAPPSEAPP